MLPIWRVISTRGSGWAVRNGDCDQSGHCSSVPRAVPVRERTSNSHSILQRSIGFAFAAYDSKLTGSSPKDALDILQLNGLNFWVNMVNTSNRSEGGFRMKCKSLPYYQYGDKLNQRRFTLQQQDARTAWLATPGFC